jgi:Ankyrin repeat
MIVTTSSGTSNTGNLLHHLSRQGNIHGMQQLLETNHHNDIVHIIHEKLPKTRNTALHYAVSYHYTTTFDVVQYFLNHCANPHVVNQMGLYSTHVTNCQWPY